MLASLYLIVRITSVRGRSREWGNRRTTGESPFRTFGGGRTKQTRETLPEREAHRHDQDPCIILAEYERREEGEGRRREEGKEGEGISHSLLGLAKVDRVRI